MRVRQATVYIDRQALQYNLNRVKQLAANSKIVSMVKANAYGHGVKDCLAALNASRCLWCRLPTRRIRNP